MTSPTHDLLPQLTEIRGRSLRLISLRGQAHLMLSDVNDSGQSISIVEKRCVVQGYLLTLICDYTSGELDKSRLNVQWDSNARANLIELPVRPMEMDWSKITLYIHSKNPQPLLQSAELITLLQTLRRELVLDDLAAF